MSGYERMWAQRVARQRSGGQRGGGQRVGAQTEDLGGLADWFGHARAVVDDARADVSGALAGLRYRSSELVPALPNHDAGIAAIRDRLGVAQRHVEAVHGALLDADDPRALNGKSGVAFGQTLYGAAGDVLDVRTAQLHRATSKHLRAGLLGPLAVPAARAELRVVSAATSMYGDASGARVAAMWSSAAPIIKHAATAVAVAGVVVDVVEGVGHLRDGDHAAAGLSAAKAGLGTAALFVGPVGAGAIGAIMIGIAVYEHRDIIGEAAGDAWDAVGDGASDLLDGARGLLDGLFG